MGLLHIKSGGLLYLNCTQRYNPSAAFQVPAFQFWVELFCVKQVNQNFYICKYLEFCSANKKFTKFFCCFPFNSPSFLVLFAPTLTQHLLVSCLQNILDANHFDTFVSVCHSFHPTLSSILCAFFPASIKIAVYLPFSKYQCFCCIQFKQGLR